MTKTWLITGSSRGIGRALAESVLASGNNLVATARTVSGVEALTAPFGDRAVTVPLGWALILALDASSLDGAPSGEKRPRGLREFHFDCGRFAEISCALLCFVVPIATGAPWQVVESRGAVSQVS
jgi:hypothetical protein